MWYKMVEVNGACKHGRCARICMKNLHIVSKVKILAFCHTRGTEGLTDNGQLAGWINKIDYTEPYFTHMDQKLEPSW